MNRGISSLPKFNGKALAARLEDGTIMISAENGDDVADFWHHEGPWIHPRLEAWAAKRGLFWEWINPGIIGACEI